MGVHPFTTYVLRKYYKATGWNEDNLYSNLTRSSDALLDFMVPKGLQFSISKAPNSQFRTTYAMNALPSLNGSIGYIFSNCALDLKSSGDVRFKDIVDRFKVYGIPKRPEGKPEVYLAGKRIDTRDYLMSGLLYLPTGQLDAFYTTRWSPTVQASMAAILMPPASPAPGADAPTSLDSTDALLLSIQHDTGRWGMEYTWQTERGGSMLGIRFLRNFGKVGDIEYSPEDATTKEAPEDESSSLKRVDEEEAMEGGLTGRLSAGAELYVSTEKSAGVSAGVRFTTVPDSALYASPSASKQPYSQPPTTITATFTPITGHISAAYAAKVSRDLALCSRFTFNVNSFESEWSMGGEWWMRRKKLTMQDGTQDAESSDTTMSLLESPQLPTFQLSDEIQGVVKAKVSTSSDLAFMWEGRIRNMLVSLGLMSNLANRSKPITAVGLELSYFSSE